MPELFLHDTRGSNFLSDSLGCFSISFNLLREACPCCSSLKFVVKWLIGSININKAAKKLLKPAASIAPTLILNAPIASTINIPNASIKPTTGCCRATCLMALYFALRW